MPWLRKVWRLANFKSRYELIQAGNIVCSQVGRENSKLFHFKTLAEKKQTIASTHTRRNLEAVDYREKAGEGEEDEEIGK